MGKVKLSLRLAGSLPSSEDLKQILGTLPMLERRCGEAISPERVQPFDLWMLNLAEFDGDDEIQVIEQAMQTAAQILRPMALSLAGLDRDRCSADLYITTVQEEEQVRLFLSTELVAAAAAARLAVQFSAFALLDASEEPEMDTITP